MRRPRPRGAGWGLVAVLAGCGGVEAPSALCPGCNVLLVSVDTLRPDHLGVYGYDRGTTPELLRHFEPRTRFTRATTPSPCTRPALAQLQRGRIDPTSISLAEAFTIAGWRTAAVASQHQIHKDLEVITEGFGTFDLQGEDEVDKHDMSTRTADVVSDRAIAWLEDHAAARPFYLWLHYFDPHDPYAPPADWRQFVAAPDGRLSDGDRRAVQKPAAEARDTPWFLVDDVFSADDRARLRDLYDSEIRWTDHQIGRVLDAVDALGLRDRTVVVLVADHGERLGEDGAWDHCYTVHELETRVPLLIRVPGEADPFADARDRPASLLDVMPTVLATVGLRPEHLALDGRSLLDPGDRTTLSVWRDTVAVRTATHKLTCTLDPDAPTACTSLEFAALGDDTVQTALPAEGPAYEALATALEASRGLQVRAAAEAARTLEALQAIGYTE